MKRILIVITCMLITTMTLSAETRATDLESVTYNRTSFTSFTFPAFSEPITANTFEITRSSGFARALASTTIVLDVLTSEGIVQTIWSKTIGSRGTWQFPLNTLFTFDQTSFKQVRLRFSGPPGRGSFQNMRGFTILFKYIPADDDAPRFMSGHLTWKETEANTVEFAGTQGWSWRRVFTGGGSGSDGRAAVGDVVGVTSTLRFGDGTTTPIYVKVTAIDTTEDLLFGNIVNASGDPITHNYSGNGPFTAFWAACCRIPLLEHINNPDGGYRVATVIDLSTNNTSPVSSLPPIVIINKNSINTFTIPAVDADGDTLRFRLSTSSEADDAGAFTQPGLPDAANALSINSMTGLVTWNTSDANRNRNRLVETLYSTQVIIEDLDNSGNPKSRVAVDYLLKFRTYDSGDTIGSYSPTPPSFTSNNCGTTINASVGNPVTVNVTASDPDTFEDDDSSSDDGPDYVLDEVKLNAFGLPTDASFSSTVGNPASGTFSWTPGSGNIGPHIITFTATDSSERQTLCNITINVTTNNPPVAQCKDVTVNANDICKAGADINNGSFDPDNSDTITLSQSPPGPYALEDSPVTVTLTVTDDSGTTDQCTAIVTIEDKTNPTLSVPADTTVECGNDTGTTANGTATGADNCNIIFAVSHSDTSVPGCGNTETITRTWTVKDLAGNMTSGDQTVTVVDTTAPSLAVPADVTVECSEDTSSASTGMATGSDTCGSVTITESDTSVPGCGNTETITRTWTATDECNNSTSATQTITVVDTTAPNLTVPTDVTVECSEDTSSASTGTATVYDTCGSVMITESDASVPGCGNTSVITRKWTATDECGNSISGDQVITVVDTIAPVLAGVPADKTVECNSVPAPASPTATDDCDDEPVITHVEVLTDGDCPDNYTLTRTWTATDDCGNASNKTQVITVRDTTDPVVTASLVPIPSKKKLKKKGCFTVEFSATDNCDNEVDLIAVLNGHPVINGQIVELKKKKKFRVKLKKEGSNDDDSSGGRRCRTDVKFEGPSFSLDVTATDDCGNEGTGSAIFVFPSKHDDVSKNNDDGNSGKKKDSDDDSKSGHRKKK